MHILNLIGNRYGKLTVESKAPNNSKSCKWICRCDCGNTRKVTSTHLRKGIRTCCVRCDAENFIGQKIGTLTVLKMAPDKIGRDGQRIIVWECLCNCGKIVLRQSHFLRRGNCCCPTCRHKIDKNKFSNDYKEIPGVYLYTTKRNAMLRKLDFNVSMEYVWKLFIQQKCKCALSGIPLIFAKTKKEHIHGGTTASLDRINSKLGYIEGNAQWVYKWINVMKSDFTNEEFIDYCTKVVNYQKEQNENNISDGQMPRR